MNTHKQIFKTTIPAFIFFIGVIIPTILMGQSGEETFKKACSSCHSIGKGRLVGPDLNGITSKRSEEWLIKWIHSSQAMIKSGDADAKAIFEEYSQIPMPDQQLSDADTKGVLEFIKSKSTSGEATASANTNPQPPVKNSNDASAEEILLGQHIFEGSARLSNKGPACISCHNLNTDRIIPGGLLAKDLTTAFSRMGGDAGISGILNAPPFPAMTEAYKDKSLTEKEAFAVAAFLNRVEKENGENPANKQSPLLKWGYIGLFIWICIVFAIWYNRKKYTVKKKIFERQITSF